MLVAMGDPIARRLRGSVGWMAVVLAGCSNTCAPGAWELSFETDSLASQARVVTVLVHTGTCAAPGAIVDSAALTRGSMRTAGPRLGAGPFALEAFARDASCRRIAAACTDVVASECPGAIHQTLVAVPLTAPDCASCVDGVCDGAVDAGPTPDTGPAPDAGPARDAAPLLDSGPLPDTGPPPDAWTCEPTSMTETRCDDARDDDCDGRVDCADPECDGMPSTCGAAGICWAGACCSGCWDGSHCASGNARHACGNGGASCVDCGACSCGVDACSC
jgi:hypothetical protein